MKAEEELIKEFATVEIAKAVGALGFDKPCLGVVWPDGQLEVGSPSYLRVLMKKDKTLTLCPLWQQIIDWLREEHHLIVEPSYDFVETQTYNVALIQEGDHPVYHATDIIEEPDFYKARQQGILQALDMVRDGTMNYLQFESWFDTVLGLWTEAGLYQRIQIDKENARMHYELGESPEMYVNSAKDIFK